MLVACTLLASCSAPPKSRLRSVDVVAQVDANQNSATAHDIVFVFDEAALEQLPATSPEWFKRKSLLTDELGNAIGILSLEITPGSVIKPSLPPKHDQAIAVFSYAYYMDRAGHPRGTLTGFRRVRIRLASDHVDYIGER